MNLVLFDLDNTLLSGDTDVEWLDFLIDEGVVPPSARQENAQMDRRYRSGQANALEYVRFYLRSYPPHSMACLLSLREKFIPARIEPRMLPAARALVQEKNKQNLVAIITATNRFLTEPIAAAFGIAHLMATEPQIVDGRFTGDIVGAPCMREGKIEHLQRWLVAQERELTDFTQTHFYSDSINDLPLLERVTHPVAVDPDPRLAEIARQRGWRSLSLR
jgi:HAD superfamily hydrolase (TIGR01490 family)